MKVTKIFIFNTILIIISLHSMLVRSQEVEDEREFSYVVGSENGPERWGEIHEEWGNCSRGELQSPIDLLHKRVEVVHHLGRLRRNYRPSNATLVNRGHDIMLRWAEGAGAIYVNNTAYILTQCHWHSPSEHTINGKRFALEVHMVHQSNDGRFAVVGIVYEIGRPDSFLSELTNFISQIAHTQDADEVVGIVDPRHIRLGSRKYYRYIGSLTTPPCTEGVVWTIVQKVRTVSKEQVMLLREAVHDDSENNARPSQLTNDRDILFYRPRNLQD